jgi:hypothetical protein
MVPRRLETRLVIFDPLALVRTVPILLILFLVGNLRDPWTYLGLVLLVIFVAAAFAPISVDLTDDGVSFTVAARRWPLPVQRADVDPARVRGFTLASYTLKTWKLASDKQVRIDLVTQDGAREVLRGLPEKHRHLPELIARIDEFARAAPQTALAAGARATNLSLPRG